MSGIAAMRIQVRVLGTFQSMRVLVAGVEVIIKALCECCPDTSDLFEIRSAGAQHALQSAEVAQQGTALGGAQSRHGLENRFVIAAGAATAVATDGEPVRLIADTLQEARRGGGGGEEKGPPRAVNEQALLAGPAVRALGNADERHILEAQW